MTGLEIYAVIKYWLPIMTALAMIIKGFYVIVNGVRGWTDRLFNNHLFHIEKSVTLSAKVLGEIRDINVGAATKLDELREDFAKHSEDERKMNQDIVVTLGILKDRQ